MTGQPQRLASISSLQGRQSQTTHPIGAGSIVHQAPGSDVVNAATRPQQIANALLPNLPSPLTLRHGPLLVTIQYWADGSVIADLPACSLSGEGDTDTAALEDLAAVMFDWVVGVAKLGSENLGGALLRQWTAFTALVDVSGL